VLERLVRDVRELLVRDVRELLVRDVRELLVPDVRELLLPPEVELPGSELLDDGPPVANATAAVSATPTTRAASTVTKRRARPASVCLI
jgi:hypothetical protein